MAAIASNADRLADPENLYILGFKGNIYIKKLSRKKKFSRQLAAILIIGGKLKSNQVVSILMGNFT